MTTPVLLAGLPGAMAAEAGRLVAEADDLTLVDTGATSQRHVGERLEIGASTLKLAPLADITPPAEAIAVDYTTPDAALDNARWYAERGVPFVMGATGFDGDAMRRLVTESAVSAVVAPNMAAPIVLLQAAARWLAESFPGALCGAEMSVRESHQVTKRDTSGTAKALVASARGLGVDFAVDRIERVRDPERQQRELGVPAEHLSGHALHRYELTLADGSVGLALEHNVLGRRVYAEGTLLAVRFLAERAAAGSRGRVFTMEDVLRGG